MVYNTNLQIIYHKKASIKAQVTVFIILAIVIVAGIGLVYVFRENLFKTSVPQEFEPVYSYYLSCIGEETRTGASILGETGGYIESPEFSPGSAYMPFSSHLNFLGFGVPYWYYISGNGIAKEQVPSKEKMQEQLNNYVENRIFECDFSQFNEKGFEVILGDAEISSSINEKSILVDVKQNLHLKYGDSSFTVKQSSVETSSNLGKFYALSKKIYSNQKETMFLENYGVDILRLYAPVDGSEIGCSPKIWNVDEIKNDLMNALESNVPAIKIKGDYYRLGKEENKYFVRDIGENADAKINFMYSRFWPMKLEVWPSENGILRANPVGLQEGLGMLGFCYVPYHFVYDFAYPVLIQIYSENEMFQFPVAVYINKNKPREALDGEALPEVVPELCSKKFVNLSVSTYNTRLEPLESEIKFRCFDTTCDIGKTSIANGESTFSGEFPQCVNGFILANTDGYETKKYMTQGEDSIMMILDKKYRLNLSVSVRGEEPDYAVVVLSKNGNETSTTISYPEQKEADLTPGNYQIKVYVYTNSSISLKGSSTEKCIDVPRSGFLGYFGATEKKCFALDVPNQIISFAVSGGGTLNQYFTESELEISKKIKIDAQSFGIPRTAEDLQANYNALDFAKLGVSLE
jgi:hypothetical protein